LVRSCRLLSNFASEREDNKLDRRFEVLFWGLAVLVSAHFAVVYVLGTTFYVDLPAYVHGQARLPFQYRALTGWALRLALWAGHIPLRNLSLLIMAMASGAVLWIFVSARHVAASVVGPGFMASAAALGFAVPLYVMYAVPAYENRFSYPYDTPSLALFFAAFAAFVRNRQAWCLAWFALACLSRETCLLLVPVVLLWPEPRWHIRLGLAGGMLACWIAAWALVHFLYAGNLPESTFMGQFAAPGGMVVELGNNWQDLRSTGSWPAMLSVFAWGWLPVLLFWRRIRHPGVRQVIVYVTPGWFLLMFVVGRLRETRIFAELTVVYWFAVVMIARDLILEPPPDPNGALSVDSARD
jgi:hypothetical protein